MPLDIPTLFVVAICITGLLGLFLLFLWMQDRSIRALGWWGAAYLIGGCGVALWMAGPPYLSQSWAEIIAPTLLFLCCGMIWTGARKFHGRRLRPFSALGGAALWLLAGQVVDIAEQGFLRVALSSSIIATYAALTALELKRERRSSNRTHRRATALALLHGLLFLSPIFTVQLIPDQSPNLDAAAFALFALMTLLYVVGTAFIVVVMAKEHSVLVHKTAAITDPLTGLFNRRGFQEAANKLMNQQAEAKGAVTVLVFDLDHFKSINDRFGHDIGDEVLRVFAVTASKSMRTADIVGRMGGEEFWAILPGGLDQAAVVAERVLCAFRAAGLNIAGRRMSATVSIGGAAALAAECDFNALVARADTALYRAKGQGRDCVVIDACGARPAADSAEKLDAVRGLAQAT